MSEHTAENDAPEPFDLARELEALCPSSLAAHLDPSRPYDGQPHTVHGERGRTEIRGITFRDLTDAFVRACYESSGLSIKEWPGSVHDLPWDQIDILAVSQNLGCNVEKAMGIYPNVPRLYPVDPAEPHWCGHTLDDAVYQAHHGHCDDETKRVIPPEALTEQAIREAKAAGWDEGVAKASPHGGGFLRSFYAENPYRTGGAS